METHSEKVSYILRTSDPFQKKRNPTENILNLRKKNTFVYKFYVSNKEIIVCKKFYLNTLSISQKMINNAHLHKDKITGTPKLDDRGSKTKDKIPKDVKDRVRAHIKSFPKTESHYCRPSTTKECLASNLNITKTYDLYKECCVNERCQFVKLSIYRNIFNEEFNLDFFQPKADRCEYRINELENNISNDLKLKYTENVDNKENRRKEREEDHKIKDEHTIVVSFHLENVIGITRANKYFLL